MNNSIKTVRSELERIQRVSNMLCSAHSNLRDQYLRYAFVLDISVFALSTWIVALAFIDPKLTSFVTPVGFDSQIWTGVLGVIAFFLSIVQLRVDWKGQADLHRRSFEIYAEVKLLTKRILSSDHELSTQDCEIVLSRYNFASSVGTAISERQFLKQKKQHLIKMKISKYLDINPSASIYFLQIKFWMNDNFRKD